MSVREKPVCSRFLDLQEKERHYSQHMSKVVRAKALINTTHPDTPRRIQVSQRNSALLRQSMKQSFGFNMRKVDEVDRRRSYSSLKPTARRSFTSSLSTRSSKRSQSKIGQQKEIDIFANYPASTMPKRPVSVITYDTSSSEFPMPSDISSSGVSPYLTEPKKKRTTVDSIKIGYAQRAIVESIDEEDSSNSENDGDKENSKTKNEKRKDKKKEDKGKGKEELKNNDKNSSNKNEEKGTDKIIKKKKKLTNKSGSNISDENAKKEKKVKNSSESKSSDHSGKEKSAKNKSESKGSDENEEKVKNETDSKSTDGSDEKEEKLKKESKSQTSDGNDENDKNNTDNKGDENQASANSNKLIETPKKHKSSSSSSGSSSSSNSPRSNH